MDISSTETAQAGTSRKTTLVPGVGRLPYPAYRGKEPYIFVSYVLTPKKYSKRSSVLMRQAFMSGTMKESHREVNGQTALPTHLQTALCML